MSEEVDVCLQCGESRASVKENGFYCATVNVWGETEDEWPRHRWADWSDAELREWGVPPESMAEFRRASIFDLQWAARGFDCDREGHIPAPDGEPICCRCYEQLPALAAAGEKEAENDE